MKKMIVSVLTLVMFGVVAAAPLAAQDEASAEGGERTAKVQKHAASSGMWTFKAETLSGTISMVSADQKLLVVDAGGVAYDFRVSGTTGITSHGHPLLTGGKLEGLTGKQVSIKFVATRTGDVAKSIEVQ